MVVTGGITWWKDFICSACFNLLDQRDEVRTFSCGKLVIACPLDGKIGQGKTSKGIFAYL